MLLFFVRHGETVDNVAGVYAGVKDSELTNHGILQARQLGDFLKAHRPPITAIFSSPLQRARKTAEAIITSQAITREAAKGEDASSAATDELRLVQTPLLIEQDFGFYEGKPFYARSTNSPKSGKTLHHDQHKDDPDFQDVESKQSMNERADHFLSEHLIPLLRGRAPDSAAIVIVSHGILLSHLWRRFLLRLPRKSITIAPEVTAAKGQIILEHLGGWSNTGFVEVKITKSPDQVADAVADPSSSASAKSPVPDVDGSKSKETSDPTDSARPAIRPRTDILSGCSVTILMVNGQEHLRGIKRARGGIGSAKHDEDQKSLHKFFKPAAKPS